MVASTRRKALFACMGVLIAFAVVIAACEAGLRVYHRVTAERRPAVTAEIVLDEELGWRATENYSFQGDLQDRDGHWYRADVRTDSRGFRAFGDPSSDGCKILFLGDSFTHAIQVSADDAYYSLVGRALDCDVFAYGVGGYGTLQELMVLRRHLALVSPDVVVLQLCSNDLINNHSGLERASLWNNNGLVRPYWENGHVVYRLARSFPGLRRFASQSSEFLYFVFSRLDRIAAGNENRTSVEALIAEVGTELPDFAESVAVTGQLLSMVRQAIPPDVPIVTFCGDDPEPQLGSLKSSSKRAGLIFVDGVPAALRKAEERGICTKAADGGHWSPDGHQAVAGSLVAALIRNTPINLNRQAPLELWTEGDPPSDQPR